MNKHLGQIKIFFAKLAGYKFVSYLPFIISLLIVGFVSYNTFHPDFIVLSKLAERIAGGNFRIYDDLYICEANYRVATMPPFITLLDGFFFFLMQKIKLIDFNFCMVYHTPSIHMLLLKSRYILTFILSYFLMFKVALLYTKNNRHLSRVVANLWIASPILLYLPFAQGNNDIYPVVVSLFFLLFAFRKNYLTAMVFLGLVAALKSYAVFLILPAAIILSGKNTWKTILYSIVSGLVFLSPRLVYSNEAQNFTKNLSESFNMLSTVIPSHGVPYSLFAIGYFLILLFLYYGDNQEKITNKTNETLLTYSLLVMSLFYMTWFYPQWFLWILPFFVLVIAENKRLCSIYLLICSVYLYRTYLEYPGNLDIYLWKRVIPPPVKEYWFPGVIKANSPAILFGAGLFMALFIAFLYFFLNKHKDDGDKKVSVYLSYLPTLAMIGAIYLFSYLSK